MAANADITSPVAAPGQQPLTGAFPKPWAETEPDPQSYASSYNKEPHVASSRGTLFFQAICSCCGGAHCEVPKFCKGGPPTAGGSRTADSIPLPGVNKKVYLRKSPVEGFGLVARRAIQKAETVWKGPSPVGVTITTAAIQAMSREEQEHVFHYFYQISEREFIGPPTEADVWRDGNVFTNHNCDPNIGWVSTFEMAAIRNIWPGEELTFDYATSETWDMHPPLKCCCGSPRCRGLVRWSDYLLPDVRNRLADYYIPYVKAKLASAERSREGESSCEARGAGPILELVDVAAA